MQEKKDKLARLKRFIKDPKIDDHAKGVYAKAIAELELLFKPEKPKSKFKVKKTEVKNVD